MVVGIQNFLDVDERSSTREDLVTLVEQAHSCNIRAILNVIVNHSGDNWAYTRPDGTADETDPPTGPGRATTAIPQTRRLVRQTTSTTLPGHEPGARPNAGAAPAGHHRQPQQPAA
jgi:hypothetical protein